MNRSYVYGGIAVLIIGAIVGAWLFFQLPDPDDPLTRDEATPEASAPSGAETGTAPSEQAATQPGAGSGGAKATQDTPSSALEPVRSTTPEFDVVRVDEHGNVVIAGRSKPGCIIIVREGDNEIARVTADNTGEWVLIPDDALPSGERQLRLFAECEGEDPAEADRVIALAIPERGDRTTVAVAVPRDGEGKTEVLQGPAVAGGTAAVGGIDYDDTGRTTITGVAEPESTVRIYLDNELVGETRTDPNGRWSITLDEPVETGSYNLRVDQLDTGGAVVARSEIPFVRGEPLTDLPEGRLVIIQPGDRLWKIARERYGSGFQYSLIFEANKEQIRNPDLIYPGQIFTLPSVN